MEMSKENKTNEILVSIIIPVYNTEKSVSKCIESCLNQTHQNIEIILVEDGSPDNSGSICDEYAKKDKRVVTLHQKNSGVSVARNNGLNHASGEYVMFVDSDDIIASFAIELLLNDFYSTENCVLAGFKFCRITSYDHLFSNEVKAPKIYNRKEMLYRLMSHGIENIGVCAKLFPTRLVKEIKFIEGKGANEDKFFLFQYLILYSGFTSEREDEFYGYYIRPGSATQSGYSKRLLDTIYFSNQILKTVKEKCPELIEVAEYNDLLTKLSLLRIIVKSRKYREEYRTFLSIKRSIIKLCTNKDLNLPNKIIVRITLLRMSDYLYIMFIFAIDFIKEILISNKVKRCLK